MEIIKNIKVKDIIANKRQPREHFDNIALVELSDSIQENGLIQPIVVREHDNNKYEIIAGERRFRACLMLNKIEVPCFVLKADDYESAKMALVENIQRSNLTAIEEAKAYRKILKETNMTQQQLSKQIAKSQASIANKLRLLSLPQIVQDKVNQRIITERHARALLTAPISHIENILDIIIKKQLNVSQTEKYIESFKTTIKPKQRIISITKNVQIAINTIKQAFSMCAKLGLKGDLNIIDNKDNITITIIFKKEN